MGRVRRGGGEKSRRRGGGSKGNGSRTVEGEGLEELESLDGQGRERGIGEKESGKLRKKGKYKEY